MLETRVSTYLNEICWFQRGMLSKTTMRCSSDSTLQLRRVQIGRQGRGDRVEGALS